MYNVYLDITNYCNLKCVFCPRRNDLSNSMKPEIFDVIIKNVKNSMNSLTIGCSWECTLSPYFNEIMDIISEHNVCFSSLYTHGNNLSEKKIDAVINAKLKNLVFSLGESNKEIYEKIRNGGDFDRVTSTIKNINEKKKMRKITDLKICVNLTLVKSTLSGLLDFIEFAHEIGIEHIDGRHLILIEGIELKYESIIDKKKGDLIISKSRKKAKEYGINFNVPLYSDPMPKKSCPNMVYINSHGDVSRCPRIHKYEKFGNAISDDISSIMSSKEADRFKESFLTQKFNNPVCGICIKDLETSIPIDQGF